MLTSSSDLTTYQHSLSAITAIAGDELCDSDPLGRICTDIVSVSTSQYTGTMIINIPQQSEAICRKYPVDNHMSDIVTKFLKSKVVEYSSCRYLAVLMKIAEDNNVCGFNLDVTDPLLLIPRICTCIPPERYVDKAHYGSMSLDECVLSLFRHRRDLGADILLRKFVQSLYRRIGWYFDSAYEYDTHESIEAATAAYLYTQHVMYWCMLENKLRWLAHSDSERRQTAGEILRITTSIIATLT